MYNVTSWLAELFFSLVFCKFHNFEFKKKWILHSHMFANLRQFVLLYVFDAKSQKVHFLINFLASKPTIALISPDCKKIHFQWDFLPEAVKSISNCSISVQSPFLNKKVEQAPGRTGPCPNFIETSFSKRLSHHSAFFSKILLDGDKRLVQMVS